MKKNLLLVLFLQLSVPANAHAWADHVAVFLKNHTSHNLVFFSDKAECAKFEATVTVSPGTFKSHYFTRLFDNGCDKKTHWAELRIKDSPAVLRLKTEPGYPATRVDLVVVQPDPHLTIKEGWEGAVTVTVTPQK